MKFKINHVNIPLNNKIRVIIFTCFFALITSSFAWAADYYVDPANGNDGNRGTLASPWRTISKANNTLRAGDTVYLRGGTYSGQQINPSSNGTAENRITYRNYQNEIPKISASDTAIYLRNRSYVTIHGIKITRCDTYLNMANGHYNHLEYLDISVMRNYGGKEGFLVGADSTYNWIHHCTISGYGEFSSGNDRGNMISIGEKPSGSNSHNLIEDNHFYHGGHGVLYLHGKYNVVRNNYLHNEEWSNGYGNRCGEVKDFTSGNNGWNLIENNRIGFTGKPVDAPYSDGFQFSSHDNIVRGNMFYACKGAGLKITPLEDASEDPDDNYIYNNVFFYNGIDVGSSYQHALWFRAKAWRGIYGNVVKNNIFWQNNGPNIRMSGGSPVEATIINNWESGNPYFVDAVPSKTTDPFNRNYPDFRLQSTSPCIDSGAFLTKTTAAGSGTNLSVKDAHYFMDGWGIIEGDVIQLENQTQTAKVVGVDYSRNILRLDRSLTWTANQGVSLQYNGAKPDIGAIESGSGSTVQPLSPPPNPRIIQ